jgi:hypothetical protein
MFVEGYVDGKLKVDFGLVENKGPLLAKALVNVKDEEKCSFYLSNVTQKGMKLGPDSVIGVLSRFDYGFLCLSYWSLNLFDLKACQV